MADYLAPDKDFTQLSLRDLLDARDQYHVHLMHKQNVVATALGRYRIRVKDPWPTQSEPHAKARGGGHAHRKRTLENSEVRPYSWPCVLVFVKRWLEPHQFHAGGPAKPYDLVPPTLYLPDGRTVPVCVVEAPRYPYSEEAPGDIAYPNNNIGGGYPVILEVQGREHVASIGCLVTDGHKTYALTNRHVCGDPGEVIYSRLDGKRVAIGTSAKRQLTRLPFQAVYADWPGKDVYVNLDVGLIDITDLGPWTAKVRGIGQVGMLADLSINNISLKLIGCPLVAYGCASGMIRGEIHGLFYRYKSVGGFEYVADLLIGRRTPVRAKGRRKSTAPPAFATRPGDSGTLWMLELDGEDKKKDQPQPPMPIALQWGGHVFADEAGKPAQSFALATCLSTVCNLLEVDPVRDWNLDQTDTWGAVGHYSIAAATARAISSRCPKLKQLMENNRTIISYDDAELAKDDFKGQTMAAFVPLADVPDNVWKHGRQHHTRGHEGPNHFADMDQKRADGKDLLALCKDVKNIDPKVWDAFYESVRDPLTGDKIAYEHRGLLPFRVRQIFGEMTKFATQKKVHEFVCAAGILAHYVGDACQPLHISYLHHGDPADFEIKMLADRKTGVKKPTKVPRAEGVHEAYEATMVGAAGIRPLILAGLKDTAVVKKSEYVTTPQAAAEATVALMRQTFSAIKPADLVTAFMAGRGEEKSLSAALWKKFGTRTIRVMQAGTHLLAVLWESAWVLGNGESYGGSLRALTVDEAKGIYEPTLFLKSYYINEIA